MTLALTSSYTLSDYQDPTHSASPSAGVISSQVCTPFLPDFCPIPSKSEYLGVNSHGEELPLGVV